MDPIAGAELGFDVTLTLSCPSSNSKCERLDWPVALARPSREEIRGYNIIITALVSGLNSRSGTIFALELPWWSGN